MVVWSKVSAPLTSGVITAVLSLFLEYPDSLENILIYLERGAFLRIPRAVAVSTTGFLMGYGFRSMITFMRWNCLKILLNYRDWLRHPNSTVTKIWGCILEFLIGPGPFDTFEFQNVMPRLPVPSLQESCDKYLKSMRPFLTQEEFSKTISYVNSFITKDGPLLQKFIVKRFHTRDNWLADWWLNHKWLSRRDPLPAYSNSYLLGCPTLPTWNQIDRTANLIYHSLRFRELIVTRKLPVLMLLNIVPVCMNSYRTLFGTVRVPGVESDSLVFHDDSKHIIVIRNGVFYSLDVYYNDGTGKPNILNANDIRHQLEIICYASEEVQVKYAIAALTCQDRAAWARQRNILDQGENSHILYTIESALFVVCLDKAEPENINDQAKRILMGTGYNRWFDKSLTLVVFGNARAGLEVELSSVDISVYCHLWEYLLFHEEYDEKGYIADWNKAPNQYLKPPECLNWDLRTFDAALEVALEHHRQLLLDIDISIWCSSYGKTWLRENMINHDGFLQMAVLLAYYRLRNEIPKACENVSSRLFVRGHRDVIRPLSMATVEWLQIMDDPSIQRNIKLSRLQESIHYQNNLKLDSMNGYGWEGHLFGLQCAAKELNIRIPPLFKDKAWLMSDILYTTYIPTRITDKWCPRLCSLGTGITPIFKYAYSVSYIFFSDELVNFHILTWKSVHPMIGSHSFSEVLNTALMDMKKLFEDSDEPEIIKDNTSSSEVEISKSHNEDLVISEQESMRHSSSSTIGQFSRRNFFSSRTCKPDVCFMPAL